MGLRILRRPFLGLFNGENLGKQLVKVGGHERKFSS